MECELTRRSLFLGVTAMGVSAMGKLAATVNKPEDQTEISKLLYRYAMALDSRDAGAMMDCFVQGGVTSAVVDQGIEFHRKFEYTVHNVLNHWFTIHESTATGTTYCIVTYVRNAGGKLTKFDTYSRYEEEQLVKQQGRWFFSKRNWIPLFSTAEIPVEKGVPTGFWDVP